jgi:hypothetical protein
MKAESVTNPPAAATHPYAVSAGVRLGSNLELDLVESEVRLPFAETCTLRIVKEQANPREEALFIKRITVELEAFATAGEAERAGKALVLSILWVAASQRATIAFDRWTGDYPFAVRDPTRSRGLEFRADVRVHSTITPEGFAAIAGEAFKLGRDFDRSVLTSMEFYASARMESTERARFIGLMTALEALSVQRDYGEDVAAVLDRLASELEHSPPLAGEDKEQVRGSLASRVRQLRQESVRQAIIRVVKDYVGDRDTIRFIDQAYGVRSKILHEGLRATDLHELTNRVEDVLRQIYSTLLSLPPVRPTSAE